jgi:hypothetical protein
MVCENVFGRVASGGAPESHIDVMVKTWMKMIP